MRRPRVVCLLCAGFVCANSAALCRGRVSLLACRCVGAISAVVILLRLLHGFDIAAITIALDLRSNPARCGGSLQMQYVNSASACFREAVLIFHEASS